MTSVAGLNTGSAGDVQAKSGLSTLQSLSVISLSTGYVVDIPTWAPLTDFTAITFRE
jgi:hypothetical protein